MSFLQALKRCSSSVSPLLSQKPVHIAALLPKPLAIAQQLTPFQPRRTWFSQKGDVANKPTIEEQLQSEKVVPLDKYLPHLRSEEEIRSLLVVNKLIEVGRHVKITAAGRIFSFSALVLGGNGNGYAGIGFGKGETMKKALEKAKRDMFKNMVPIAFLDQRTIPQEFKTKFRAIHVKIIPKRKGQGLTGCTIGKLVCQAFGLEDVMIRVIGGNKRNKHNRLLAIFKCITDNIWDPAENARARGKKLLDINRLFFPPGTASWSDE